MASYTFLSKEDYVKYIDHEFIYAGTVESVSMIILHSSQKMCLRIVKMDIKKKVNFIRSVFHLLPVPSVMKLC